MSLLELWKKSKNQLENKKVHQIIGFAGEGKLLDGSEASKEFRDFLSQVPSDFLAAYADQCLTEKFDGNGFALQDVINQIGQRLGFAVEHGRYRGGQGQSGHDGLWKTSTGKTIIVEAKTTDTYRIDLNTLAEYRRRLIQNEAVTEEQSSVLIIVGREDTGGLEAQIRGSRHAWDIRLVSISALVRLMRLKENIEDPRILRKISEVLIPQEFTRVDSIIDLVFSTTEDVRQESETKNEKAIQAELVDGTKLQALPANFNDACALRIQASLKTPLVKQSRTGYASPDGRLFVYCSVSRTYGKRGKEGYWYAFHTHQRDKLASVADSYAAFGCGSENTILLIPYSKFSKWLDGMNVTRLEDRVYWHVQIFREGERLILRRKKGFEKVDLTPFFLSSS